MEEKNWRNYFFEPPSLGLKMAASGPRVKFCDPPLHNFFKKKNIYSAMISLFLVSNRVIAITLWS